MKVSFTLLWIAMYIPRSAMPHSLTNVAMAPKYREPNCGGDLILYGGTYFSFLGGGGDFLHVTLLPPRILRRLLDFWKILDSWISPHVIL